MEQKNQITRKDNENSSIYKYFNIKKNKRTCELMNFKGLVGRKGVFSLRIILEVHFYLILFLCFNLYSNIKEKKIGKYNMDLVRYENLFCFLLMFMFIK